MTKIYAGFPGVGKSYLFKKCQGQNIKISDSDSSLFSWVEDENGEKVRNPEFPTNYVAHIQKLKEEGYDIILVSTHKEVLQALVDAGIMFIIVTPHRSLKDAYLERYRQRNSPEAFVTLIENKWDEFMDDIDSMKDTRPIHYLLEPELHLSHIVNL